LSFLSSSQSVGLLIDFDYYRGF